MWDVFKVLKEDDFIKVFLGDKGYVSIVMNINNYYVKMFNFIKNRLY